MRFCKGPTPSATKIARTIVHVSCHPKIAQLLPPGAGEATARLLRAAGLLPDWMLAVLSSSPYRFLYKIVEMITIPGLSVHFALRKRFFDETVREGLSGGARQVLVVGCGMDALSSILAPEYPDVLFVEIDTPETVDVKLSSLEQSGHSRGNHVLRGADLSRISLDDLLLSEGTWNPEAPSIAVAEGLLMYLPPPAVRDFFRAVRVCGGPSTRVAFSCLGLDGRGRPSVGSCDRLLRLFQIVAGERFRWGIDVEDLPGFLTSVGFELIDSRTSGSMLEQLDAAASLPDPGRIETFALAEAHSPSEG